MKVAYITPDFADKRGTSDVLGSLVLSKRAGQRPRSIGGAGYYRCQLPADGLNRYSDDIHAEVFAGAWSDPKTGILYPVKHQDRYNADQLICDETGWDIIVLQRWMAEADRGRILRARSAGQVVIQDVDDHFWAVDRANNAYHEIRRKDWNAEYYRANLAVSDHITVSTPYLAEHLADLGVPITVIGNAIDLDQWTPQPIRDDLEAIGWCGHTGFRSGDLETVGNAVRHFLKDHPKIRFIHGGHDPASTHIGDLLNLPKHRIETRRTRPIERWPAIWHGIDVAIIPLNDVPFNRAKSALKGMEASASNIPFIATRIDSYQTYGQGQLVTTPTEWRDALEASLDHNTRQHSATLANTRIQQDHINVRWKDWYTVYRQVCPTT